MPSPAVEDYLKAIYQLSDAGAAAGTTALADRLGVTAGSVTGMLKRLSEHGWVEHVPYYGARLTAEGNERAVGVIRRHRILELFLVEVLGYTWDQVHEEADRLEHAASALMIERMSEVLGRPELDPHGAPIPGPAGEAFEDRRYTRLSEAEEARRMLVRRVADDDAEVLRYLAERALLPGTEVEVLDRPDGDASVRVRVGGSSGPEHVLPRSIAETVQVEPIQTPDEL